MPKILIKIRYGHWGRVAFPPLTAYMLPFSHDGEGMTRPSHSFSLIHWPSVSRLSNHIRLVILSAPIRGRDGRVMPSPSCPQPVPRTQIGRSNKLISNDSFSNVTSSTGKHGLFALCMDIMMCVCNVNVHVDLIGVHFTRVETVSAARCVCLLAKS